MARTIRLAGAAGLLLVATALAAAQPPMGPGATPGVTGAPPLPGGGVPPTGTGVGGVGTGVGGVGTGVGTGTAGAAQQKNIWGFFMRTPDQKAQCQQQWQKCCTTIKTKFCGSQIGQMTNGLLLQMAPATGGLIKPLCPVPLGPGGPNSPAGPGGVNPEDLKKDPTTPEGAAARIKVEENPVVIKAKVEALQFLGTVDCRYYPEAAAGLITGLRAEKNECVRLAAAKALANGCCCNPKIVKALLTVVNCSNKDGFPAEPSELVRAYAYVALERCMRHCTEPESEKPPEPPPAAKAAVNETVMPFGPVVELHSQILLASYFAPNGGEPAEKIYTEARQALSRGLKLSPETLTRLSGPRNVHDAVMPHTPTITPADVVARLDRVVANAVSGPRERTTSFISTLPKREPEPVMASESKFKISLMPSAASEPPESHRQQTSDQPRSKTSMSSLWQEARQR